MSDYYREDVHCTVLQSIQITHEELEQLQVAFIDNQN